MLISHLALFSDPMTTLANLYTNDNQDDCDYHIDPTSCSVSPLFKIHLVQPILLGIHRRSCRLLLVDQFPAGAHSKNH